MNVYCFFIRSVMQIKMLTVSSEKGTMSWFRTSSVHTSLSPSAKTPLHLEMLRRSDQPQLNTRTDKRALFGNQS